MHIKYLEILIFFSPKCFEIIFQRDTTENLVLTAYRFDYLAFDHKTF